MTNQYPSEAPKQTSRMPGCQARSHTGCLGGGTRNAGMPGQESCGGHAECRDAGTGVTRNAGAVGHGMPGQEEACGMPGQESRGGSRGMPGHESRGMPGCRDMSHAGGHAECRDAGTRVTRNAGMPGHESRGGSRGMPGCRDTSHAECRDAGT